MIRYVYRSAATGHFVSRAYAEANPETTIRHQIGYPDPTQEREALPKVKAPKIPDEGHEVAGIAMPSVRGSV